MGWASSQSIMSRGLSFFLVCAPHASHGPPPLPHAPLIQSPGCCHRCHIRFLAVAPTACIAKTCTTPVLTHPCFPHHPTTPPLHYPFLPTRCACRYPPLSLPTAPTSPVVSLVAVGPGTTPTLTTMTLTRFIKMVLPVLPGAPAPNATMSHVCMAPEGGVGPVSRAPCVTAVDGAPGDAPKAVTCYCKQVGQASLATGGKRGCPPHGPLCFPPPPAPLTTIVHAHALGV